MIGYKNYSPALTYFKEFASFMNSLPITDPQIKLITSISDKVFSVLNFGYEFWQKIVTYVNNEKKDGETIKFTQNTKTNKLSAKFRRKYDSNGVLDLTGKTNKNDAQRGFVVSLSAEKGVYDSESEPILYKDSADEFKVDFVVKPNRLNVCYAQNVVTNLTFNLKKDQTALLGKHTLDTIESEIPLQKSWLMTYDPNGEFENNSKIEIGNTYFTDVPNNNRKKSFIFTPSESKTYALTLTKFDSRSINYQVTTDNSNVSSIHGVSNKNCNQIFYPLVAGREYKFSFSSKVNPNLCNFRIDGAPEQETPYAINSSFPIRFEANNITSRLYSFYPKDSNKWREQYIFQTGKIDSYYYPDTYLEILDEHFDSIIYSDNTKNPNSEENPLASIIISLKTNQQYYVCVKIKQKLHTIERVQFRIMRIKELGWYDVDNRVTYSFILDANNLAMCFHLCILQSDRYYFAISGSYVQDNVEMDIQTKSSDSVRNQETETLLSGEMIQSGNLVSGSTYYFVVSTTNKNANYHWNLTYWRIEV